MLFTAGVFPGDPRTGIVAHGDITAQTHRVLDSFESILRKAGCTMKDLVKINVYLADFGDFAKMDEVMAARFGDHKPARLEVDFVARLP